MSPKITDRHATVALVAAILSAAIPAHASDPQALREATIQPETSQGSIMRIKFLKPTTLPVLQQPVTIQNSGEANVQATSEKQKRL